MRIREMFWTVQGEGSRTGSPSVFVRFAGCNLWSGLEHLRHKGKGDCAAWCDTDFASGDPYTPEEALAEVQRLSGGRPCLVVLTGGEPMLQLRRDKGQAFVHALRREGYTTALETNGTQVVPEGLVDHITVSPKGLAGQGADDEHLIHLTGDDLKVVWPTPFTMRQLAAWAPGFRHLYLQPKDVGNDARNTEHLHAAIEACHHLGPAWRVSIQTHKFVGLP